MVNTSATTNSLENFFMPFTANKDFKKEPRLLERGEGVYYYNHKGDKVIDCSSGLFCVPLGHGRKEIADAVHQQLLKLDYAPSFAISHMPAFTLAERLAKMLPGDLNNIFFTICGSTAIDSAIKIIQAYQHAKGQSQRVRFVSRERAYHGVNIGGTSLSGMIKNREVFTATMPGVIHLRHTWLEENKFNLGQPEHGDYLADDLQRFVDMYGPESIAGCFVEPIAGSTGTLVPPKGYLEKLRATCDKYGIVLVFDEVITGFGRTGEAFGANKYNVQPDMITLAKAITNGAQPMGAVAVSDDIYNTIINNPIYLSIAVVLCLLLIYGALKKFIKMIIIALICIVIYLGYLYFTGDEATVKDVDKVIESVKDSKSYLEDQIKENLNNE